MRSLEAQTLEKVSVLGQMHLQTYLQQKQRVICESLKAQKEDIVREEAKVADQREKKDGEKRQKMQQVLSALKLEAELCRQEVEEVNKKKNSV